MKTFYLLVKKATAEEKEFLKYFVMTINVCNIRVGTKAKTSV